MYDDLQTQNLLVLKSMVKSAYDLQQLRIQTGGRLASNFYVKLGINPGEKKEKLEGENKKILTQIKENFNRLIDGIANKEVLIHRERRRILTAQGLTSSQIDKMLKMSRLEKGLITEHTELSLSIAYFNALNNEKDMFKMIESYLSNFDIWNKYMLNVPGIGPAMGGVILSTLNPYKADYVSSFHAVCGLDTVIDPETNKRFGRRNFGFHLVEREYTNKKGESAKTKSLSYNKFAKSKIRGVLADVFMKRNSYYRTIYHDYKNRLLNQAWRFEETSVTQKVEKGKPLFKDGKPVMISEFTPARLTAMSQRYMIKMFLKNLWVSWRHLEGLSTEPGYEESKLGMDTSEHVDPWGLIPLPQAEKNIKIDK